MYKEAGSICENLTECGVNLPSIVQEKLEVFNKKEINKIQVTEVKEE
ncbi:MAG: phage holin family protein [Clostridium sp.]